MNYTIIGYREDKDDYCMSCYMGGVSSDFTLRTPHSFDDAVKQYAELEMAEDSVVPDLNIDNSWELTILFDGREYPPVEFDYLYDRFFEMVEKQKENIRAEREEEKRLEEQRQAAEREAAAVREAVETKARELRELWRLQEKYGEDADRIMQEQEEDSNRLYREQEREHRLDEEQKNFKSFGQKEMERKE